MEEKNQGRTICKVTTIVKHSSFTQSK
uniref:Uncharacterized protein n=1 Tax=Nelumbo nucifera TaxID=4432 RepID=A0A822YL24_NELNU|nr:TPA_asm: hypothetical protein HUJ06_005514 [Nelumbo nucifera]